MLFCEYFSEHFANMYNFVTFYVKRQCSLGIQKAKID